MARLGDILVANGAITRGELEQFLDRHSGRLGSLLRAHTLIRSRPLAQALAEQQGLPFIELAQAPLETSLFQPHELGHYLQHHYLPHRQHDGRLRVVTPEPSPELQARLAHHYNLPVDLAVISMRDFTTAMASTGATTLTRRARLALRRRYRHLVADRVLVRPQIIGLMLMGLALVAAFIFAPATSWRALLIGCNLFYLVTLAFKLQLYAHGRAEIADIRRDAAILDHDVARMDDGKLPAYSILVPLYKESFAVVARLVSHLHALDYPKEKLDIKLICEADDLGTIEALKSARPPETMEIIRVAPSEPRTKPKACNVALQQIRGEYLVIFDAEDAPEPQQLKKAIAMFRREPREVACLQSPLNYYNRNENLLTKLFSIEYSSLFNLLLPAMQRMGLPIPLGGTSNHMRVEALKRAGGWDAFNVTEDADLGIRLAWFGYRTRMLPSLTLEEAPIQLSGWLKQRTRWVKGYIQTWLVFMRQPAELKSRLGPRGYYGFQFFVGAPALTFLLAPVFWAVFFIGSLGLTKTHLPPLMIGLCAISFLGGILSHLLFARSIIRLEKWKNMGLALAAYPFYWLLHSLAAARACWQLIVAPHYWDKTTHGVSSLFAAKRG
jgi:cellulose synthase/poly-beta-1,6-N-acetylglucosamine synthase-like glycosyltransferase